MDRSPTIGFIDVRGAVRPSDAKPLSEALAQAQRVLGLRQLYVFPSEDGGIFISRDATKLEAARSAGLAVPQMDSLVRTFGKAAKFVSTARFPDEFSAFSEPVHEFEASTDAAIVKSPSGTQFVKKFAKSADQLRREWLGYKVLEAVGIPQPPAKLYMGEHRDKETGAIEARPVMVSEFIGNTTLLGSVLTGDPKQDKPLTDALKKAIVPLTIIGDRDLIGLYQDNVLVRNDAHGRPDPEQVFAVDRGASFGKAAGGGDRPNFDARGVVQDLRDYTQFHVSSTFLGALSSQELASMIRGGLEQKGKIFEAMDAGLADLHRIDAVQGDTKLDDLKPLIRGRMDELAKLEQALMKAGDAPASEVLSKAAKAIAAQRKLETDSANR